VQRERACLLPRPPLDTASQVAPCSGSALLFFPGLLDGTPDLQLQHSAEPPSYGAEKWVAQLWVRQRPLHDVATVGLAGGGKGSEDGTRSCNDETSS
jgi:hypothetical protein